MLKPQQSVPAGRRGRSAGSGRAVWPSVCLSAHVAVLLRSLSLMPVALMLPFTQGPWTERGEVVASWRARSIRGFSEASVAFQR